MSKCFLNCNHHPFLLEKLVCLSYYYVADCGRMKVCPHPGHTLHISRSSRIDFFLLETEFCYAAEAGLELFIFMPWSSKSWNHSYISQCLVAPSARMLIGLILYRFCAGNLSCCKFRSVDRASLSSLG